MAPKAEDAPSLCKTKETNGKDVGLSRACRRLLSLYV